VRSWLRGREPGGDPDDPGGDSERPTEGDGSPLSRWLAPTGATQIDQIELSDVRDGWTPERAGETPLVAMMALVRAVGVVDPVLLRPGAEGGFEVVTGHRTVAAARAVGYDRVPAVVREMDEVHALVALALDGTATGRMTERGATELMERLRAAGMDDDAAVAELLGALGFEAPVAAPAPVAAAVAQPEPEPVAATPEPEPEPVQVSPVHEPEPVAAAPEPEPELQPVPAATVPEPEPVAATPEPVPEPVVAAPEPELQPVLAEPEPELQPVPAAPEPEPEPVAVAPEHEPQPVPAAPEPEPEPVAVAPEHELQPVPAAPEPEPVAAAPASVPEPVPEPVAAAPAAAPSMPPPAAPRRHPPSGGRWVPMPAGMPRLARLSTAFADAPRMLRLLAAERYTGVVELAGPDGRRDLLAFLEGGCMATSVEEEGRLVDRPLRLPGPDRGPLVEINVRPHAPPIVVALALAMRSPALLTGLHASFVRLPGLLEVLARDRADAACVVSTPQGAGVILLAGGVPVAAYARRLGEAPGEVAETTDTAAVAGLLASGEGEVDVHRGSPPPPLDLEAIIGAAALEMG
jgi:ParB-like nuclease family protein